MVNCKYRYQTFGNNTNSAVFSNIIIKLRRVFLLKALIVALILQMLLYIQTISQYGGI